MKQHKPKTYFTEDNKVKPIFLSEGQNVILPTNGSKRIKKFYSTTIEANTVGDDVSKLDTVEKAKRIRKDLKGLFPNDKFSVRIDRSSTSSEIRISWTDGSSEDKVKEIVDKYEDIDRDPTTGEILLGGNSYVDTSRTISPELMSKIEKFVHDYYILENSTQYNHLIWETYKNRSKEEIDSFIAEKYKFMGR